MRSFVVALLPVLALGACGGGDGAGAGAESSAAEQLAPYADALASTFTADDVADGFQFTDESAGCVATRAVRVVGIDRLEQVGDPGAVVDATAADLSVFDLDQSELDQISAAFLDCIDGAEQILRDAFLGGVQLEGDQATCVADLVDRDLLIRILSAGIGGQSPEQALADVQTKFTACAS